MTYKEEITSAMKALAEDPKVRFIGYGVCHGRAMGTLKDVPEEQLIETPVAENLMVGMAIGLSLKGYLPVVFIERMDFILNALDAIVNHLDKVAMISRGEFQPAVILRAVVGNSTKPLYTGITHTQDFTEAIRRMVSFRCVPLRPNDDVRALYFRAYHEMKGLEQGGPQSTLLVEYKDYL